MSHAKLAKLIPCHGSLIQQVLSGEKSFGYEKAKRAVEVFGGDLDIWHSEDPKKFVEARRDLINKFKQ